MFDVAPLLRGHQHGVGRLVEDGAHLAIAALGGSSLDIDGIAGLNAPRRQAKMRANGLRFDEPARIVDRRFPRQCRDRIATQNRFDQRH